MIQILNLGPHPVQREVILVTESESNGSDSFCHSYNSNGFHCGLHTAGNVSQQMCLTSRHLATPEEMEG